MKVYFGFVFALVATITIILACVSKPVAAALPECINFVKTFAQTAEQDEIPQLKPLGDGGALAMLIKPAQKSARGLIISSPHTKHQFELNKIELTAKGQCQADGLVFEVSAFEVEGQPAKDPT